MQSPTAFPGTDPGCHVQYMCTQQAPGRSQTHGSLSEATPGWLKDSSQPPLPGRLTGEALQPEQPDASPGSTAHGPPEPQHSLLCNEESRGDELRCRTEGEPWLPHGGSGNVGARL